MTFEEAKEQAQQGIKVRHQYFAEKEYMTMKGNLIVFEDGCEIFKLSKDVRNESMRIALVRSMDSVNERVSTDATIMSWLQFQLIDRETASTLYGRATLEEALVELREYNKRLSNQQRMAAQQQQQMAAQQASAEQQAGEVIYGEGVRDKVRDQQNKDADRMVKMQEIASK